MKKSLLLMAAGLLASASVWAAINWNNGAIENLAFSSTVTVSSKDAEAANITDNNSESGWQAIAATHSLTNDWALIDLGEKKTFTDIEIMWQAAHCSEYSVYVLDEAPAFIETQTEGENPVACRVIAEEFFTNHTADKKGGDAGDANYTESFTFDEAVQGRYILVYANEYNGYGRDYGMRIFEVRVAEVSGRDEITEIRVSQEGNAVAGGASATVTVTPFNKMGDAVPVEKIDNISLTCDNPAVNITKGAEEGTFTVSASTHGDFTLVASAKIAGTEQVLVANHNFNVAYNWNSVENIATGKDVLGRFKDDVENTNPAANAVDGNLETYYEFNGDWGGGDGWLLVDLGGEYKLNAIGALYSGETARGQVVFGYGNDITEVQAKIAAEGTNYVWPAAFPALEGWSYTPQMARIQDAVTTYAFAEPVNARYVLVRDADNPANKPHISEVYVAGEKYEYNPDEISSISLSQDGSAVANGEPVIITVTPITVTGATAEANKLQDITLTCENTAVSISANAEAGKFNVTASAAGTYILKASAVAVESQKTFTAEHTLNVKANFNWGENLAAGKNIMGRMITDGSVAIENPVTNAVDGNTDTYYEFNGDWGGGDGWLLVDLGGEYKLSAIGALYTGASANGQVVFGYGDDITEVQAKIDAEGTNYVWPAAFPALEGWSYTPQMARLQDDITTYNFESPVVARYVLVRDADNPANKPHVAEIYVRGEKYEYNPDEIGSISLGQEGSAVVNGDPVIISVSPITVTGNAAEANQLKDITLTCENTAVSISANDEAGKFNVTASATGSYVLKASAVAVESQKTFTAEYTLTVKANFNWGENLAAGKTIMGRMITDGSVAIENPVTNAVDGDTDTYYEFNGEWGGGDGWLLVDLGDVYMVSAVGALYTGASANGQVVFGYGNDIAEVQAKIDAEGTNYVWPAAFPALEGWSYTPQMARLQNDITTYNFENPVVARYVLVRDADNPANKPHVAEIYVRGVKREAPVATKIELSASGNNLLTGEKVDLSARVLDQYNSVMEDAQVALTCNDNRASIENGQFSASAIGQYIVNATCGQASAYIEISVVADSGEKHKFTTATEHTFLHNDEVKEVNVFADGVDYDKIYDVPATLVVEFAKPCEFTLLMIKWEASCPSSYTVEATYDDNTTSTLFSISDRQYVGGIQVVDRIVPDRAADSGKIKTLKMNITAKVPDAATYNWPIHFQGIEAYSADELTGINDVLTPADANAPVDVYNLQGVKVRSAVMPAEALQGLPAGIYIVGGRKVRI